MSLDRWRSVMMRLRAVRGAIADRCELAPGQAVARPQPIERRVGGVGEAVAVAEVVPPALLVDRDAEPLEPADAVGLPRRELGQRQLVVGRCLAEAAAEPIATRSSTRPSEVAVAVSLCWRGVRCPRTRRSRRGSRCVSPISTRVASERRRLVDLDVDGAIGRGRATRAGSSATRSDHARRRTTTNVNVSRGDRSTLMRR